MAAALKLFDAPLGSFSPVAPPPLHWGCSQVQVPGVPVVTCVGEGDVCTFGSRGRASGRGTPEDAHIEEGAIFDCVGHGEGWRCDDRGAVIAVLGRLADGGRDPCDGFGDARCIPEAPEAEATLAVIKGIRNMGGGRGEMSCEAGEVGGAQRPLATAVCDCHADLRRGRWGWGLGGLRRIDQAGVDFARGGEDKVGWADRVAVWGGEG